jgi:hypothetical protein
LRAGQPIKSESAFSKAVTREGDRIRRKMPAMHKSSTYVQGEGEGEEGQSKDRWSIDWNKAEAEGINSVVIAWRLGGKLRREGRDCRRWNMKT